MATRSITFNEFSSVRSVQLLFHNSPAIFALSRILNVLQKLVGWLFLPLSDFKSWQVVAGVGGKRTLTTATSLATSKPTISISLLEHKNV